MADRSFQYERVPQAYRDDPSRFALSPLDRVCLDRWLAGETQASIAKDMGVSSSRIGARIFRAERHIKQQIRRAASGPWEGGVPVLTAGEEERWWKAWLLQEPRYSRVRKAADGMLKYRWRSRSGNLSKHIASYDLVTFAREVAAWEGIVKGIASS